MTSAYIYTHILSAFALLGLATSLLSLRLSCTDRPLNRRHVLTGSYHNYFRIYDTDTLNDVVLQADKSAFKAKKIGGPLPGKPGVKNGPRAGGLRDAMQLEPLDFNKKILHASWHPRENTIAVCHTFSGWDNILITQIFLDRGDKQSVLVQCRLNAMCITIDQTLRHNRHVFLFTFPHRLDLSIASG